MGENITGQESGAVYQLKVEQDDNTVDEHSLPSPRPMLLLLML